MELQKLQFFVNGEFHNLPVIGLKKVLELLENTTYPHFLLIGTRQSTKNLIKN